jgi:sulfur carrier protein
VIVELNGKACELHAGATVADALQLLGVAPNTRGVAVAVDLEVVRRGDWQQTELSAGARVEVLNAIQGG